MKRSQTVKSNNLFNHIINEGKRNSNKYFVICSESKDEEACKFGIAVGTKIGNAVERNRIKRQIRSIIDRNYMLFSKNHNYIIIVKKEIIGINFQQMEKEFVDLINKGETHEK